MITSTLWAGKTFGVFGLARTGKSVIAALAASGATALAWDDGEAARATFAGELTDLHSADLSKLDAMIVSPGVPHDAPLFRRAVAARIPVIGDIELFAQARAGLPAHKVVAVTGTNGKSTTAALIHHMLVTAGIPARLGGNIGAPILSEEPLAEGGVYVLELSSFQLDLTYSLVSEVAVLLNITPDHLDRHKTMAAYAAAKARLFAMQIPADFAIIGQDDRLSRDIGDDAVARVIPISAATRLGEGVSVTGGRLVFGGVDEGAQADWPALAGPHNAQNAAAAVAAALVLGIDRPTIARGLASYPGLPHRMERIAEVAGVAYVNDSKATNPTSTAPALAAFAHVHWIAGGLAKTDELDACLPFLGHVRAAYLIGQAAPVFADILDGRVPVVMAETLDRAVALAAAAARPGDTVLLSPACASYDQFTDYAARGAAFRQLVEAL
ncbi:UDP-N-acetylmuramoyl-L-alanine--D-glutamate ligase [Glacieibacterium megasporae]|uniref:UDP-N-acetylmuramoyl-L-alanine--D-glutamate ligase n=1 Tax=Glacieibacterium megasporae TaxID=2835787 RepID=UPI001C1E2B57|nr:UDP-N-acetylmuramoyl-L-alanine--D-glutamate ligase [Polymorphobacter megasporae]UAJ11560.1 UDP-N-acetylmuramoyl-L-alanine--D-glutamate ligase [Polymorphobacter megasporae]